MTITTAPPEIKAPMLLPGSAFPSIHKSGGPLRAALESLPEWVDVLADLAHLDAIRPPRRNVAGLDVEMEAMLTDCVANRTQLDLDAVSDLARTTQDRLAAHNALNRGFEVTATAYAQRLDAVVRDNEQAIYDDLTRQVTDVVTRARDVADAFNLDAEGAITAGRVDAWQETTAITRQYVAIRGASSRLEQYLGDGRTDNAFSELWWIENPAEVFAAWRAWKVDGYLIANDGSGRRQTLRPPWPDDRAGLPVADLARGWLVYLASTPEAVPWVPSPQQYAHAAEELGEYAAGIRQARPRRTQVEEPTPDPDYVENTTTETRRKARVR